MRLGCLPFLLFAVLLALLPLLFIEVLTTAMAKLRLTPQVALLVVLGIIVGSVINIPVSRIRREEEFVVDPVAALFGLPSFAPLFQRRYRETIIAVNVGGCVIPSLVAVYEIGQLLAAVPHVVGMLLLAVTLNVFVCYKMAMPIPNIGIAMPAFVPPLVAVIAALLLTPDEAPAVAFVAGVLGPLIGADLLHLRDIPHIATGMASIGGAGTFDGIVLSGVLAAYLA
ncbi:MAG: DUF1614 domain-containing protein [Nitrospirae bacterium]|nr:MAG: DUF1614 domain-containing protein [Nitrospirota bacterium]